MVLVLHPTCAHLYAAADGTLRPAGHYDPFRDGGRLRIPRPGDQRAGEARDELNEAYLRGVDKMLGDYRAEHPSPLVLAGPPHLLDRFCALSRNLTRLTGRVVSRDQDTALDLAMASTQAIEGYLRARREDALGQLTQALRVRPGDVSTGIADCWRTSKVRRPSMLLVEENFISPGNPQDVHEEGSNRRPVAGEVHDLVDDLMEKVILTGGQLALVRDGDLTGHDRIALISRARRPEQNRST